MLKRTLLAAVGVLSLASGAHAAIDVGVWTDATLPSWLENINLDPNIGTSIFNIPIGLFMGNAPVYAASDQVVGERLAPGATTGYIAVEPDSQQTFIFNEGAYLGVHIFSLDAYNNFDFTNSNPADERNLTGQDIAGALGMTADGSIDLWITIAGATEARFTTGQISEEFNVGMIRPSTGGAPELSTWAMMGLGFAGLAFAGVKRSRTSGRLASI